MTRTISDEAESDVHKDDDGSIDEKNGNTDCEEHRSAEATTHEHQSKDPEGTMSNIDFYVRPRGGCECLHCCCSTTWMLCRV